MKMRISILILLMTILGMTACGSTSASSKIEIQDPWARIVGAMDAPAGESSMGSGAMETNTNHTTTEGSMGGMIGSTGAAYMTIKTWVKKPICWLPLPVMWRMQLKSI